MICKNLLPIAKTSHFLFFYYLYNRTIPLLENFYQVNILVCGMQSNMIHQKYILLYYSMFYINHYHETDNPLRNTSPKIKLHHDLYSGSAQHNPENCMRVYTMIQYLYSNTICTHNMANINTLKF